MGIITGQTMRPLSKLASLFKRRGNSKDAEIMQRAQAEWINFEKVLSRSRAGISDSGELLAAEKEDCSRGINGFLSVRYNTFGMNELSRLLRSFWDAAENPTEFVGQHFGKILAPSLEETHASMVRHRLASDDPGRWLLALSREFLKAIHNIDRKLQGRILEALGELADEPMTPRGDTVKPLSHDLSGLWRYRVGDYRLIYQPVPEKRQILLVSFAARGSVY